MMSDREEDGETEENNLIFLEEVKAKESSSEAEEDEIIAEEVICKKNVPNDKAWLSSLDDETLKIFKRNQKSQYEVEDLSLKCTSCYQQINPKQRVSQFFNDTRIGGKKYSHPLLLSFMQDMVHRHPILNVPICKSCKKFYFDGDWTRDEDGFYEYCRWCANGGDLLLCSGDRYISFPY